MKRTTVVIAALLLAGCSSMAEQWVFTRPGVDAAQLTADRKACNEYASRLRVCVKCAVVPFGAGAAIDYHDEFATCMVGKGYTEQPNETASTAATPPSRPSWSR